MRPSVKKLIAVFGILIWLVFYAGLAAGIGAALLPDAHWLVEFLYYMLAGTLWIIPIGLALPWMHREPDDRE